MTLPIGRAIAGENGDRLFKDAAGRSWRVRVREVERIPTLAPTSGGAVLPAAGVSVAVSVALLDDDRAVVVNAAGEIEVFDAEVVTIAQSLMACATCDPDKLVREAVQRRIAAAGAVLDNRAKLSAMLTRWNASPPAAIDARALELPGPEPVLPSEPTTLDIMMKGLS